MFDDLQDATLETELCAQAAHVNAGECRLMLLIGEFDHRNAWAGFGINSCAHWLNWRVGTSLGTAREQVRVGRALPDLPFTRAAFESGELSYSKVRAITRIATPDLDESLVEMARHSTASQLEVIIRSYRNADPDEVAKADQLRERRYLRTWTDDEGMVVLRARFTAEEGATVLAAIESARDVLAEASKEEAPQRSESVSAETSHLAEQDNPWSQRAARAELSVDEPLSPTEVCRADALVALSASFLERGLSDEIGDPHISVIVHVDEQVLDDPSAPGCAHLEGLGAITGHAAARLACEGSVARILFGADGRAEPQGTTRAIPRRLRRALLARDRGCRFPGCVHRRYLHAHHVVFWSKGGPTALSNLVTLCSAHHRLVHEGGFRLELERSGHLRVFTPDGVLIPNVGRTCRAEGPSPAVASEPPAYGGERFDLALTVDALLGITGKSTWAPQHAPASPQG